MMIKIFCDDDSLMMFKMFSDDIFDVA